MTPGRRPRPQEEDGGSDEKIVDWIVLKHDERDQVPADQVVWRWARMSKSKGNVVTPDDIDRALRRRLAARLRDVRGAVRGRRPVERGGDPGLAPLRHPRLALAAGRAAPLPPGLARPPCPRRHGGRPQRRVRRKLHQTVQKVGAQIETFQFNTAVAAIMELLNEIYAYAPLDREALPAGLDPAVVSELAETLTLLLAPFAPHLAEEVWQQLGGGGSVYRAPWPAFDPEVAAAEAVNVMVQVNGKIKDKVSVALDCDEETVKAAALRSEKIRQLLAGRQVVKMIFIKNKMLSIVCK